MGRLLLKPEEVAKILRCSKDHVIRKARTGELPAVVIRNPLRNRYLFDPFSICKKLGIDEKVFLHTPTVAASSGPEA